MHDPRSEAARRIATRLLDRAVPELIPTPEITMRYLRHLRSVVVDLSASGLEAERACSIASSLLWLVDRVLAGVLPGPDGRPPRSLSVVRIQALSIRGSCRWRAGDFAGGHDDLQTARREALDRGLPASAAAAAFDLAWLASEAGRHDEAARRLITALAELAATYAAADLLPFLAAVNGEIRIGRIDSALRRELDAALADFRRRASSPDALSGRRLPPEGPAWALLSRMTAPEPAESPSTAILTVPALPGFPEAVMSPAAISDGLHEATALLMQGEAGRAGTLFRQLADQAEHASVTTPQRCSILHGLAICTIIEGDVDRGRELSAAASRPTDDRRLVALAPSIDGGAGALYLMSAILAGFGSPAMKALLDLGLGLTIPALLVGQPPSEPTGANAELRVAWSGGISAAELQASLGGAVACDDPWVHLELLLSARTGLSLSIADGGVRLSPAPWVTRPDGPIALARARRTAGRRYGTQRAAGANTAVATASPSDRDRPTVLLTSHDPDHLHLSHAWLDLPHEPPSRQQLQDEIPGLAAWHAEIPAPFPSDDDPLGSRSPHIRPGVHQDTTELYRGLTQGAFARDPQAIAGMLQALGNALIGPELFARIRWRATQGGAPVRLRLQPAASLARVPWPLLIVDDECLAQYCDITIDVPAAIIAGRQRVADWSDGPAVRLIDPDLDEAGVLPRDGVAWWRALVSDAGGGDADACVRGRAGRDWLSRALRHDHPSRLFYLGHVRRTGADGGSPALAIPDSPDTASVTDQHGRWRYLTAHDLMCGTALTSSGGQLDGWDGGWPAPPGLVGSEIWPMPAKVAFFACQSGADLAQHDAIGLVAAAATAGARLITATAWPMLTDAFFAEAGCESNPVEMLARRVDACHDAPDPIAALGDMTRQYIAEWRAHPCLETSPLTWGALQTFTAPGPHAIFDARL